MGDGRILLGVVGRPHGVRGLVHVQSYTAEPAALSEYGTLLDDAGRHWTLAWQQAGVAQLRDAAGVPLADRNAAERLTNTRLYVERDRLPPPPPDEFYLSDLEGLEARDPSGAVLGRVTVVHDYGAGISLEIARDGMPALIVPFTRGCVPVVDPAAGVLTVVVPDEIVVQDDLAEAAG